MPLINETSHSLEVEDPASGPLGRTSSTWSVGRMVLFVFAICLAIWITIFAYFLHL